MGIITTFNKAVSDAINKTDETYVAIIGTEDFVPEPVIEDSYDYNCGALCNELEYLRAVSAYYVQSFDLDIAENDNLDLLINTFIDLPRRNRSESDDIYRNRYRAIAIQKSYPRRTTKWSILEALAYFLSEASLQVIEPFDTKNLYFEIRIEGAQDLSDTIFLDNEDQAYLDQNYVGGEGVGAIVSYIGEIVDRIRAAGVDFDILFISQDRFSKTSDAFIGAVQIYKTIDATIRVEVQITKTSDSVITV